MKKKNEKIRALCRVSMFTLISLGLSYVESLIPPLVPIAGVKLGLANLAVIFVLYRYGAKQAAIVSTVRVLLSALLFGNPVSMIYALAGAVTSIAIMTAMKKSRLFSEIGVSVAGAISHNAAQIAVAAFMTSFTGMISYLPLLIISAVVSGIVIGIVSAVLIRKCPEI